MVAIGQLFAAITDTHGETPRRNPMDRPQRRPPVNDIRNDVPADIDAGRSAELRRSRRALSGAVSTGARLDLSVTPDGALSTKALISLLRERLAETNAAVQMAA